MVEGQKVTYTKTSGADIVDLPVEIIIGQLLKMIKPSDLR